MPLIMAIQCNEPKIVQMMIDAGAEINIHFDNITPLIHAIQSCHVEVVRVLINSGADVNMEDKNLQSPLAIAKGRSRLNASEDERETIVKMLIEAGAQE
jgi:ankyrin repeat protein